MFPVEIDLNCKIPTAHLTPGENQIRIRGINVDCFYCKEQ